MTFNLIDSEVHIQKVLTIWRKNFLNSDIIIIDSEGIPRVDIIKARKHLNYVWLCNVLFSDLSLYNPNAKYVNKHTASILKSDSYKRYFAYATELIHELNIEYTLEQLINDFNSNRLFLKQTFQNIFKSHGIPLNDKMLDVFFGKKENLNNPGEPIDLITEFTKGTSFHKSLRHQFSTTNAGFQGTGIFSIFFMRAAGLLDMNGYSYKPIEEDQTKYIKGLSPLWTESKITRVLIRAALSTQMENT